MTERTLFLDADNLAHKWGFSDGAIIDDWWWEVYDDVPSVDAHDLLFDLVKDFLLPELEKQGYVVELTRIHTNHNPVRAEKVNGEEVDWYEKKWEYFIPTVTVEITKEQLEEYLKTKEEEK